MTAAGSDVPRLLAELRGSPSLARPRRLVHGAVLPEGHLDLTGARLGADAPALFDALDPTELRGLWLAGTGLALAAVPALAALLARSPGLVHLDLADNALGPAGAHILAPALAAHPGLRGLDLGGDDLDLDTTCLLAHVLERSGILHLALGRLGARLPNRLDAGAWAAALRRDPPWATLDLRGLGLPAEPLADALADNSRLRRLDLDAPLPGPARARLCHNANRRAIPPPPRLEHLYRALPEPPPPAPPPAPGLAAADLDAAARVLGVLSDRPDLLALDHPRLAELRRLLARARRGVAREDRRVRRQARLAARRAEDRRRVEDAEIRRRPSAPPDPGRDPHATIHELHTARPCYVCRRPYTRLHFFYDRLCPECAALSYTRRCESIDLRGRVAVVTGGRVKIGHHVALRLLGWGARVIVTTRFAADAARRFAAHPDFAAFRDRLQIVALDLRAVPHVERFAADLVARCPRVDIVINNAAQTVRRPLEFYAPLLAGEAPDALPPALQGLVIPAQGALQPALPGPLAASGLFPADSDDGFGQPLDLRERNSWRLRLDEVSAVELLEVQLINVTAPFVLNARLRGAMARPPAAPGLTRDAAFIVNVSAPEGRFDRGWKSPFHAHTNMAKAALNMMTRTAAGDYADDGIHMTSVDTGWASNENPRPIADAMAARGFRPPLDLVDAATRVCDPIVRGLRDGELLSGVFLKDFAAISW